MSNQPKVTVDQKFMDNFVGGSKTAIKTNAPFHVGQTSADEALLFSIGEDENFYVTAEKSGSKAGWEPTDLSQQINSQAFNAQAQNLKVRHFDIQQSTLPSSLDMAIDGSSDPKLTVATIVEDQGSDHLVIGTSHPDHTNQGFEWKACPFDFMDQSAAAPTAPSAPQIKEVKINRTQGQSEVVLVDTVAGNGVSTERYIINPNAADGNPKWSYLDLGLALDHDADSQVAYGANYEGESIIYTLGLNAGTPTLSYVSTEDDNDSIGRLHLPGEHLPACMVVGQLDPTQTGNDLFVMSKQGALFHFGVYDQEDGDEGKLLCDGGKRLENAAWLTVDQHDQTFTFGVLAGTGQYFQVDIDREVLSDMDTSNESETPSKVKISAPLVSGVSHVASYRAQGDGSKHFLFPTSDGKVKRTHLSDNTEAWKVNDVLLPAVEIGDSQKVNSNTWQFTVSDEEGNLLDNHVIYLKAKGRAQLYVNGNYQVLSDQFKAITTDDFGVISIVEPMSELSGSTLIWKAGPDAPEHEVDPNKAALDKLLSMDKNGEFENPEIKDENGKSLGKLITGEDVDKKTKLVGEAIKGLKNMHQNKDMDQASLPGNAANMEWEMVASFSPDLEELDHSGVYSFSDTALVSGSFMGDVWDSFSDGVKWLYDKAVEKGKAAMSFIKDKSGQFFGMVLEWGEKAIRFVVNTAKQTLELMKGVFEWIGSAAKKVWNFLKMLFNWNDISRTKEVIKASVNHTLQLEIDMLGKLDGLQKEAFEGLKDKLRAWKSDFKGAVEPERVPDYAGEIENEKADTSSDSNFLSNNLKNGMNSGQEADVPKDAINLFDELDSDMYEGQVDASVAEAEIPSSLQERLLNLPKQLVTGQISVNEVVDLIFDVLIKLADAVEQLISGAIKIMKKAIEAIRDVMNTPIRIPILSDILEDYLGIGQFSILDIVCYLMAFPATLNYKLLYQKAPFRDKFWDGYIATSYKNIEQLDTSAPAALEENDGSIWNQFTKSYVKNYTGYCFVENPRIFDLISLPGAGVSKKQMLELNAAFCLGAAPMKFLSRMLNMIAHKKGGWSSMMKKGKEDFVFWVGGTMGTLSAASKSYEKIRSYYLPVSLQWEPLLAYKKVVSFMRTIDGTYTSYARIVGIKGGVDPTTKAGVAKTRYGLNTVTALMSIPCHLGEMVEVLFKGNDGKTKLNHTIYKVSGVIDNIYTLENCWLMKNPKNPGMMKAMVWTAFAGAGVQIADAVTFRLIGNDDVKTVK